MTIDCLLWGILGHHPAVCNACVLTLLPLQRYSNCMSKAHIALYGNVSIARAYCGSCRGFAFVLEGKLQCCNRVYNFKASKYRRISEPEFIRRDPRPRDKKEILKEQNDRCFYCDQEFGTSVYIKGETGLKRRTRLKVLRPEWDHLVPYSWHAKNDALNIVAACQCCNAWKGAIMFNTVEEAKVYVFQKWENNKREIKEEMRVLYNGIPSDPK